MYYSVAYNGILLRNGHFYRISIHGIFNSATNKCEKLHNTQSLFVWNQNYTHTAILYRPHICKVVNKNIISQE